MNTENVILSASRLHIERGGVVILHVDEIVLLDGEVISLIGPNGAGKSTLLQALAVLIGASRGELHFRGQRVGRDCSVFDYRRRIAMVFQEPLLFDSTVFDNVSAGLKFRHLRREEVRRAVMENLERFGISHLADRSARTLSGGEAQRTSLARAFAVRPDIIFLDEPFSALDPPTREGLLDDFERVIGESSISAILATHDRNEALRLSDRMAVMNGGEILQIGYPEEVINRPCNEFVANFVGAETIINGTVVGCREGIIDVRAGDRIIEAVGEYSEGTEVVLCVRPENVVLSLDKADGHSSMRNVFMGTVEKVAPAGLYHKVSVDCGFPVVAYVSNRSAEDLSLEKGTGVFASFKATSVHVITHHGKKCL